MRDIQKRDINKRRHNLNHGNSELRKLKIGLEQKHIPYHIDQYHKASLILHSMFLLSY